ncbi:hypothetical protein A2468_03945 [Candidatus Falkowbacteria bacterium RIFOXYC2_FULL_46_15]|nr:MAG: hypothetical protein A2468_03945 [Candidatus Falkowbacteria bacterium RIFOXYC2_FULL_46_15]
MDILRKKFCDWDERMQERLKRATLEGGWLRRFIPYFPESPTMVIMGPKQLMGWAFVLHHEYKIYFMIYVHERYRGRGLATCLIKEAIKDFPVISLAGWDRKTKRLFGDLQKHHPGRIEMYDFWKNVNRFRKILDEAKEKNKKVRG